MPRPLDDLGPDFDRRWKQAPRASRRALIAELRDLYLMLEDKDAVILARLRSGQIPLQESGDLPLLVPEPAARPPLRQGTLFSDGGETAVAPPPVAAGPRRDNPFLPRSVLDRLEQSRNRASAGLRDLAQATSEEIARRPAAFEVDEAPAPVDLATASPSAAPAAAPAHPPSHEQSDLERELRLKLGPVVDRLIESQLDELRRDLQERLHLELDRLIAEHLR